MAQHPTAAPEQDSKASEGILDDLKAGASQLAERVYDTGHRKAEEAAFYAELGYEEARDWARSHPGQALGIAAGIGLLVGLLVARR
ncbi:DUF883 family protein [Paracoccus shandongensis]|uniref:DUF883 family protein n=1 Tax=Paracoccus shandongensis TaxID=2816048 RepID=UPI001A8C1E51|nr:DUF883 family protein [Paracoccus shandongensis]